MNRLIRDLLDFASIQAGRLSVSLPPQDVAAMVERGAGGVGAAARRRSRSTWWPRSRPSWRSVRSRPRHPAVLEPGRQRGEVHARRRHDHGARRRRRRGGAVRGRRHRPGHLRPTSCRTSSIATTRRSDGTATASGSACRSRAASSRRTAGASGWKAGTRRRTGDHLLLHPPARRAGRTVGISDRTQEPRRIRPIGGADKRARRAL